mmetsp:Transcript_17602/g.49790  ORF Transcript_17602/g.49790 Transcript_17602/m.49790 type:complete len:85 (-) Transcript_17602:2232-2486(-)
MGSLPDDDNSNSSGDLISSCTSTYIYLVKDIVTLAKWRSDRFSPRDGGIRVDHRQWIKVAVLKRLAAHIFIQAPKQTIPTLSNH